MEVAGPRAFVSEIHTREKNARGEILGEQKDILKICKKKKKKVGASIFFKCLEISLIKLEKKYPDYALK